MIGKPQRTFLAALALAAALSACIPDNFPTGTFHGTGDQAALNLELSGAGTMSLIDPTGTVADTASIQVSENEIAIQSDATCPNTAGIYTWAYEGRTLRLTLVSDDCAQRKDVLTGSDWIREQPPATSPYPGG